MRRSLVALPLLAAVLVLAATGCGGGGESSSAEPTTTAVTTEPTTTAETTTGGTTTETGDAANGATVFTSAGCGGCHTLSAAGSTGSVGPNLDDLAPSFDTVVHQVTNGGGGMPSFKDTLSEQEIRDVAAYVSSSTS